MSASEITRGQVFADNDPRMKGRRVRIMHFEQGRGASPVIAVCEVLGSNKKTVIRVDRMFCDGKARRSGFSLVKGA